MRRWPLVPHRDLFFAEVKRVDTRDKLNEKQVRCMAMYVMLGLNTVLVEVAPEGKEHVVERSSGRLRTDIRLTGDR